MTQQAKLEKGQLGVWPFVGPNLANRVQAASQTWVEEQEECRERTQKMLAAWMERRQEAFASALHTAERLYGCRDMAAIAAIYGEWLESSTRRVMADMSDAREEALTLMAIGQRSLAGLMPQAADPAPAEKASSRRAAAE